MRRALVLVACALAGALLGAGATVAAQDRVEPLPAARPSVPPTTTAARRPPTPAVPLVVPGLQLLLAWTPGGLPAGLDAVATGVPGVEAASVVRGDPVALARAADAEGRVLEATAPGWVLAIDAIAVDPATYAAVAPPADRVALEGLGPGEAVLGATAASLRSVGPGARLVAGTVELVVVSVVPDAAIGGAELAVDLGTGAELGVVTPRFLVVAHDGDRAAVEAAITAAVPVGTPIRFRGPGETPFLRAGDAVLPPVLIKDAFGEFAHRVPDPSIRDVVIDPAWVDENIATAEVPILGQVRCHRAVLPALEGAMRELAQKQLAATIAPRGYDGCWVPRLIGPGGQLSRHAWGVAIDLNFGENPTGAADLQDPRLVEVMERWGFTWGGRWLVPDPAHFEYVAPAIAP